MFNFAWDWRKCCTLKEQLAQVLNLKLYSDVSILVQSLSDPNATEIFRANSFILKVRSCIFDNMLQNQQNGSYILKIEVVNIDTFKRFLKFMYADFTEINTVEDAWDLYSLGQKYLVEALKDFCSEYIRVSLNPQNAIISYEKADLYGLIHIKMDSFQIILSQTPLVLKLDSFVCAKESTISSILNAPKLNMHDLSLFNHVEDWLKNELIRRKEEGKDGETETNKLAELITSKFTFSKDEFHSGPHQSIFLTKRQKMSMIQKYRSKSSKLPIYRELFTDNDISPQVKCECIVCPEIGVDTSVEFFDENSLVKLPNTLYEDDVETRISFYLKTKSSYGTLFYFKWFDSEKIPTTFRISICDGFLEAGIYSDTNKNDIIQIPQKINDGQVHHIGFYNTFKQTKFIIDGISKHEFWFNRIKTPQDAIYLGGINNNEKSVFVGCIADIKINHIGPVEFNKSHLQLTMVNPCRCDLIKSYKTRLFLA